MARKNKNRLTEAWGIEKEANRIITEIKNEHDNKKKLIGADSISIKVNLSALSWREKLSLCWMFLSKGIIEIESGNK